MKPLSEIVAARKSAKAAGDEMDAKNRELERAENRARLEERRRGEANAWGKLPKKNRRWAV